MPTPDFITALGDAMGLALEARDLDAGHMALRALVVYVVLVAIIRIGHQRLLDRTSPFDIILGILLGSVASRAITGNAPFWPSLAGCAVLVAMHAIFAFVSYRSHAFSVLTKGKPKELVRDGEPDRRMMAKTDVTDHDLMEALRLQGMTERGRIALAHLERNGKLSIVPKPDEPKIVDVTVAQGVQTVRIQLG